MENPLFRLPFHTLASTPLLRSVLGASRLVFLLPLLHLIGSSHPLQAVDSVVTFHEIQYHPRDGGPEWIELHNQMSIRVDLSGWRLSGGVDYTFPEGSALAPGSFLVVGGTGFQRLAAALGPFDGRLDNAGESLMLLDRNHRVMDRLEYRDRDPWPPGPDGSGMTLAKRRPGLATAEPDSWETSSNPGGTPGAPNVNFMSPSGLVISEIGPGMVELHHRGTETLSLEGMTLRNGLGIAFDLVEGRLGPGEFLVVETVVAELGSPCFLLGPDGRLLDAVRVENSLQARAADSLDWHHPEVPTPGEPNRITLEDGIVIHEIMYHFPPHHDEPGTVENEYREREEEWIELYNRSDREIDLSGWRIVGGVGFEFPGGTTLQPGGYLVVARDDLSLAAKYPDIVIAGDYDGKMGNGSDEIELRDARDNIADRVRYHDGGRWPAFADGGGSSLELRDPWADNAVPEAWEASREADKAEWVTLAYEGRGNEPVRSNNPNNFHEFLMGLLDAGEVLVDDVSVIEDPGGAAVELMKNGGFEKTNIFSGNVTDWRMLGTHAGSRVEKNSNLEGGAHLRLIADGAIEHTYNNVSSTFPLDHRLDAEKTYAISLRAKWVRGSPQLNTRLYLNRLPRTHLLPIPDHLGTPGKPNSVAPGNIGPTMETWRVSPLAPRSGEPVNVSLENVQDPQGVAALKLHHRAVGSGWKTVPMTLAEDGTATGEIPGHPVGALLHFYVEAVDGSGAISFFPAGGPASRALLRVGEPQGGARPVDRLRLLMLPDEHAHMRRPEHAVSNGRIGGTLIVSDEDFHVDVGVRLRSSPYGRRGNRAGYNIAFGSDQPFRGVHDSIAIDRGSVMPNGNSSGFFEVRPGAGVNELLVNQIAQRARGIPTTYEDVIFIETPDTSDSSLAQLRMARYGSAYLDGQYENGAEGPTHKFELIYHPTRTIDGRSDGLKGPYESVRGIDIQNMREDKEAYRFNFIPTNNRDRDDFTGIIRLGEALSARSDTERREKIPAALDVDQWMRAFAFESLIGVADTYNMGLEHNLVLYTRPADGRVLAFPWDLDHAFYYAPNAALLGRGGTNLARFISLPENRRLFYGHLQNIIETAYNTEAMAPWIQHLTEVTDSTAYRERLTNYIDRRANFVLSELKKLVSGVFKITTNGGNPVETAELSVILEGQGGVDVRAIRHETTGALLDVEWTGLDAWKVEVPLALGENVITLQAVDFQGRDLGTFFTPGSDRITVTLTGDVEAARAGNLVISEIHYHPSAEESDAEFLELQNVGKHVIDLAGIRFTRGIDWHLAKGERHLLGPGEFVLLVHDVASFESRYESGLPVLGSYAESRLNNGGETLRLEDAAGAVIQEFRYGDGAAWPSTPDGLGASLVYRSGDPGVPFSWRPSRAVGGSPGASEAGILDEGNSLENHAFGDSPPLRIAPDGRLSLRYRTTADDLLWTLESSSDLRQWSDGRDTLEGVTREDDPTSGFTTLTWKPGDSALYHRLKYQLQP